MPRKGRSNEEIIHALHQVEGGEKVTEVCRRLGVSEQTFYRWKKRFGALGVTELRELRQLRDENRKLKGRVADLALDKTILHEALRKMVRPAAGRALVPRTRRRDRDGRSPPRTEGDPWSRGRVVVAGIMWIVAAVAWLTDPPADRSVSVSVRRCRGMALLSPLGRTEYARGDLHQILLLRFL